MVEVFIDGASLGNPGKIGIGYLIYNKDRLIKKESLGLGIQTNNFAEYMALIFSLIDVYSLGVKECRIYSDSRLLCEQIKGNYKVKNSNILPLYHLAKRIMGNFNKVEIVNITRDKNHDADRLARNGAISGKK